MGGGSPVPSLGPTSPAQFVHHEPVIYLDDGGGGRSSLQYNYLPPPPAHPPGYTIPSLQPPSVQHTTTSDTLTLCHTHLHTHIKLPTLSSNHNISLTTATIIK